MNWFNDYEDELEKLWSDPEFVDMVKKIEPIPRDAFGVYLDMCKKCGEYKCTHDRGGKEKFNF